MIIAPTKDIQVTFGTSRMAVRGLYRFFDICHGQSQYVLNAEGFQDDRNRIFEMYHSQTDSDVKSSVHVSFS